MRCSSMIEPLTSTTLSSRPANRSRFSPDRPAKVSVSSLSSTTIPNHPASHNGAPSNSTQKPSHHSHFPAITGNHRHSLNIYLIALILITCCCSIASATPTVLPPSSLPLSVSDPFLDEDISEVQLIQLQLSELAKSGTILVDPRPQPMVPAGTIFQLESDLQRRQNGDPFSGSGSGSGSSSSGSSSSSSESSTSKAPGASSTPAATKTTSPSGTVASSSSSVSSAIATASPTSAVSSPLPSPFDTTLGTNYTTPSCPNYITSFLNDATFKSCLPFSMLLESSFSFFQAEKSITLITQTLDATCAGDVTKCNNLLSTIANNLTSPANCQADYRAQNPIIMQILTGLTAYKPLYQASCLKNANTGSYCFADAITNASSPTDSYVYYLALNNSLPGGAQPTCNTCLQNTMAVFDAAAANRSQPVSSTYVAAAQLVNVQCGPGFVNASIPAPVASGAGPAGGNVGEVAAGPVGALVLAVVVAAWLF